MMLDLSTILSMGSIDAFTATDLPTRDLCTNLDIISIWSMTSFSRSQASMRSPMAAKLSVSRRRRCAIFVAFLTTDVVYFISQYMVRMCSENRA